MQQAPQFFLYLLILFTPPDKGPISLTQAGYYKEESVCQEASQLITKTLAKKGITVQSICVGLPAQDAPDSVRVTLDLDKVDINQSIPGAYTLQPGDTLEGIAQQRLGKKERWKEILDLNILQFQTMSQFPTNQGLAKENLVKMRGDTHWSRPRTLLIPSK